MLTHVPWVVAEIEHQSALALGGSGCFPIPDISKGKGQKKNTPPPLSNGRAEREHSRGRRAPRREALNADHLHINQSIDVLAANLVANAPAPSFPRTLVCRLDGYLDNTMRYLACPGSLSTLTGKCKAVPASPSGPPAAMLSPHRTSGLQASIPCASPTQE
ncbi:hypothetical protein LZ32DRAFT_598684 [Colletotrichum eremochloae]|nr:hypothetical protein LZ32DRAFT_598684 [Colletotrichum eremochloae]